jgi:hypothetical protein
MINITTMRDAGRGSAIVIRFVVCLNKAVDRSRGRNEGNRDRRSYKSSQRKGCEERPDTGSDTFGEPTQHCLADSIDSHACRSDCLPEHGAVK